MGSLQLRHTGQLAGEALMVSRTHFPERSRVPSQFRNQRIVSRPGVRILTRTTVNFVTVRGPGLPLSNSAWR